MTDALAAESRPYHHGDLSRALVDAARRLLESEGPSALSLRAVAREAGVSPAAPYHHFKDKGELLDAVAHEGWMTLDEAMAQARSNAKPEDTLIELGLAYVCFARDNPALYRVMYDAARDKADLPMQTDTGDDTPYCKVRDAMIAAGADPNDAIELEMTTVAAWCGAHGLAEMAGFKQFEHLKESIGGERAFLRDVLRHMGLSPRTRHG